LQHHCFPGFLQIAEAVVKRVKRDPHAHVADGRVLRECDLQKPEPAGNGNQRCDDQGNQAKCVDTGQFESDRNGPQSQARNQANGEWINDRLEDTGTA